MQSRIKFSILWHLCQDTYHSKILWLYGKLWY